MKALNALVCVCMRAWQDFLDTLNSDGGHILLLAIMVWLGMLGIQLEMPKADDLFVGAFTALLVLLKTSGSNKSRRERPEPEVVRTETTVQQISTTPDPTPTPEPKPAKE